MRKVVTGSQVAQLRNPDPFAVPAWRSPVYRTPFLLVAAVQLARLLWRLTCLVRRHPLAAAVAALVGWLYVIAGRAPPAPSGRRPGPVFCLWGGVWAARL